MSNRATQIFLATLTFAAPPTIANASALTQTIYNKIAAEQVQQSTSFTLANDNSVQVWDKQAGLFSSYIKLNFVGGDIPTFMRNNFSVFDNNFFVTAWTLEALMESQTLNAITIDPTLLKNAMQAELSFNDKNRPDSALITFWPQQQNQNYWQCSPTNLEKILNDEGALSQYFMNICTHFAGQTVCSALFSKLDTSIDNLKDAFSIPADADDTALNLSMGATLSMNQNNPAMNQAYQNWRSVNTDAKIKTALQDLMQYTYQPLSSSINNNVIDPRSYYAMHQYLDQYAQTNPSLITTWAFNLNDEQSELNAGITANLPVAMPFNTNNTDPSVESNFIYAIATLDKAGLLDSILNGDTMLQAQLEKSLIASTQYITWMINNDAVMKRPDITIIYYPAKYNLYLFASRTVSLYANAPSKNPVLNNITNELSTALQEEGTQVLLATKQTTGSSTYWDDFLGDADHKPLSKKPEAEDRIYSTAVVVNTLLNIWTAPSSDGAHINWRSNTPSDVKIAVAQAVNWLEANIIRNEYKKDNVFFSGSVKNMDSLPFVYPANLFQYIDGRPFNPSSPMPRDTTVLIGMQGYAAPSLYQSMINATHFGYSTPTSFAGFNDKDGPFPFWSAPVLTYAFTLDAIAKYAALSVT